MAPSRFIWLSCALLILLGVACSDDRPQAHPRVPDSAAGASGEATSKVDPDTLAAAPLPTEVTPLPPLTKTHAGTKYGIKAARVIYYNSRVEGYDTLFFDGYGSREAYYTAPDLRSATRRQWVAVYARGVFAQYDAFTRGGDRMERPQPTGPIVGFMPDIWNATPDLARIYNAKRLESRQLLGRTAEGFEFKYDGRRQIWLWEGIPLYHLWNDLRDPSAAPLILEAKDVDVNFPIPASRFSIPKEVKLTDKSIASQ